MHTQVRTEKDRDWQQSGLIFTFRLGTFKMACLLLLLSWLSALALLEKQQQLEHEHAIPLVAVQTGSPTVLLGLDM